MKNRFLPLLLLSGLTFTSCLDDEDLPLPATAGEWEVTVVGGGNVEDADDDVLCPALPSRERLTVDISGYDAARDGVVMVSTDADWLTLSADTLSADSIIVFTTTRNDTGQRRTATLTFSAAGPPQRQGTITLTQLSASDNDINGGDALLALYVGYGYDIYAELDAPMSVRTLEPVIDINQLAATQVFNFEPVHDSRLSDINLRYYAAHTLEELSTTLTKTSSKSDYAILGSVETCKRLSPPVTRYDMLEQNVGYAVLTKRVASRVLDLGAVQYLRRYDSEHSNSNRLCLSRGFKNALSLIRNKSGNARRREVEDVLLRYGTHIVVQADLGGKLDYIFSFAKQGSFLVDKDAREEAQFTLGQLADDDRTGQMHDVTSSKSASGAILVLGGAPTETRLLVSDIKNLDQTKQLPPEHLQRWLASIDYSGNLSTATQLDVVHFELMPLWDLVPSDLRQDFLDGVLNLAQRSDFQLPSSLAGTDIYEFQPQGRDSDLFAFPEADDQGSLCRLLYYDGVPVLEACSEYVPKIRTDKRVTVVYPIYRQNIRMNQGFFLGDGVHQPAIVGFSGADSYVYPLPEHRPGEYINTFYYVNGNLQLDNPSTASGLTGKDRKVQDDYFYYVYGGTTHKHPIVKIGSLFWTRRDIDHKMAFSPNPNKSKTDEYMNGGVLYARYDYDIYKVVMADNRWTWGYAPNTIYEGRPNTRWYLPSDGDVNNLHAYLGFNPKALFPAQVSGFDARFNGYYGIHDFVNDRSFDDGRKAVRYQGELNVIGTRNMNGGTLALLLVLDSHYRFTTYPAKGDWHEDYFPVRPVRGYMFEYPTLQTINQNMY